MQVGRFQVRVHRERAYACTAHGKYLRDKVIDPDDCMRVNYIIENAIFSHLSCLAPLLAELPNRALMQVKTALASRSFDLDQEKMEQSVKRLSHLQFAEDG